MSTVAQEAKKDDPEEAERQQRIAEMPSLSQCFNLHDFEAIARRTMKKAAWGYYSSAADDEIVSLVHGPHVNNIDLIFFFLNH